MMFKCLFQPVGDVLPLSCAALDPDIWDKELLYQLVRTQYSQFFSVDTTNGCQLRIAKVLDSETTDTPDTVFLGSQLVIINIKIRKVVNPNLDVLIV